MTRLVIDSKTGISRLIPRSAAEALQAAKDEAAFVAKKAETERVTEQRRVEREATLTPVQGQPSIRQLTDKVNALIALINEGNL